MGENMSSLLHVSSGVSSQYSMNKNSLQGYSTCDQQDVLAAIDVLIQYKKTVHDFTDAIIDFWSLPQKIMQRYRFSDAEELNEWLDNF